MLIKNGLQQSSRWNLDDFDGDDPNVRIKNSCQVPESVIKLFDSASEVYFLHPRLTALAKGIPKHLVDNVTVTQLTTVTYPEFTDFEGAEQHSQSETHTLEHTAKVYSIKSAALVELPHIDLELCGTFANALMKHVKSATVFTPGQVYDTLPLSAIYCNVKAKLTGIPEAQPPSIVQGSTAALLSAAQRLEKSVTGVIVFADGPAGFEAMLPSHVRSCEQLFLKSLGLSGLGSEPEISALYL